MKPLKRNQKLFVQDRAGWIKKTGKGQVVYFMPGHSKLDYENKKCLPVGAKCGNVGGLTQYFPKRPGYLNW